eukprot:g26110.t1
MDTFCAFCRALDTTQIFDSAQAKKPAKKSSSSSTVEIDWTLEEYEEDQRPGGANHLLRLLQGYAYKSIPEENLANYRAIRTMLDNNHAMLVGRAIFSVLLLLYVVFLSPLSVKVPTFIQHCDQVARSLSNPQVVFMSRDKRTGQSFIVDDYLKGYQWIDENTPKDSRVMAWWDYGYQITGIAKRTSIADGASHSSPRIHAS